MTKLRTWLRLLAGMISLSIGGEVKSLLKALKGLADISHEYDKERAQASLTVLAAFAKSGAEEFLGLPLAQPTVQQLTTSQVSLKTSELRLCNPNARTVHMFWIEDKFLSRCLI